MDLDRRKFLLGSAGVAAATLTPMWLGADAAFAEPRPDGKIITSAVAMKYLRIGNARWSSKTAVRKSYAPAGVPLEEGQWPIAAIVSCADSRVQPDELFDLAPANLFVVRNAGNVIDDDVLGSLEYAVEHLGVTLIVAMGHSGCGAVKAAEAVITGGKMPGGHVDALVNHISPALKALPVGHSIDQAVAANAKQSRDLILSESSMLEEAKAKGELQIVGATYSIPTRKVAFL